MQIFKLRPGEYQRDSDTRRDTVYLNLDYVARITPGSWDKWGGHLVLKDGSEYKIRKDTFDRLMQAIQAK